MPVSPCAVVPIVHSARDDGGSLSAWGAQGDPAVNVDCWVNDGGPPPTPHPPGSPGQSLGCKSNPDQHRKPSGGL